VQGDSARFLATVECAQVLRVGDREGRRLPAHLASGGKAVLAGRPEEEVAALYAGGPVDVAALLRELRRIRRRGFALNDRATEPGVTAVGRALRVPAGATPAALSVAMPTARFHRDRLAALAAELAVTADRIERDLVGEPTTTRVP
jgi:IclR family transcriptional regulator, acetate operon repressor